jgi:cytoskeletal protein RodZ
MRQVLALFTACVFTLGLAGAALAQGTSTGTTNPPSSSSSSPSSATGSTPSTGSGSSSSTTDTTKSTAPSGSSAIPSDSGKSTTGSTAMPKGSKTGRTAAAMRGQHRVVGEVTKVDHDKGMLTLKTDEGDMDLHFPPSALSNIKEGERVEVQMAIRPASAAGAKTGSKGAAKSGASSSTQPKTP